MSIKSELLGIVTRVRDQLRLPPIRRVFMPEPEPSPERDTEFGLIELADGAVGLYYAWLGESQKGMNERFPVASLLGRDPGDVAELYARDDEAECSIGLAAINAVTQSVFTRAGLRLEDAADSMGELALAPGDHLGMIGNFPSLVRQAEARQIRLTVVERKPHMVRTDGLLTITLAPEALTGCNKVIATAATLINDSLDEMLPYCAAAETIVVIGPTAGFFPDPLFGRGVALVGGTQVTDPEQAIARLGQRLNLGSSARKFALSRRDYPGVDELVRRARGH